MLRDCSSVIPSYKCYSTESLLLFHRQNLSERLYLQNFLEKKRKTISRKAKLMDIHDMEANRKVMNLLDFQHSQNNESPEAMFF